MTSRRQFITLLVGAAAAWPVTVRAQRNPPKKVGVVIVVSETDPQARIGADAFRGEMQHLGWNEGDNIEIDYRFIAAQTAQIEVAVRATIAWLPDVIVASTTPVVAALEREGNTIPVVFNLVSDPVGGGFIESLARPGGVTTGLTNLFDPTLGGKWLALLKEIAPRIGRAALIYNPNTNPASYLRSAQATAPRLGVEVSEIRFHDISTLKTEIAALGQQPGGALLVQPDVLTTNNRALIMSLAVEYQLPAIYPYSYYPIEGGLMSFGIDIADQFRRTAKYVGRILKGANPAELPVQSPSKFDLVINLRTAKALGLTVPTALLARADEVIE